MLTPPPTAPSTFSAGTSQSANTSSQVSEPRMPSLSSFCAVEKPLHAFLDQERRDAARAGGRIGLGIDHQRVGMRAVGDPHLAAVEDVAVALLVRAGRHRDHVGAGADLRHRQRADMLAGDQLRQVFALLRVGAVAADLVDAEIGMRAVGQPDRAGGARNLLHRHAMLEIAEPGPAPLLLDRDAVHAERAELGPELAREGVGAVDLVGARRDLVGGEAAHAVAQQVGGLAEVEIEAGVAAHVLMPCGAICADMI